MSFYQIDIYVAVVAVYRQAFGPAGLVGEIAIAFFDRAGDRKVVPSAQNGARDVAVFRGQVESFSDIYLFEDIAGVYRSRDERFMFAVCERYRDSPMLRELPQGRYLCAECAASDANVIRENLLGEAQKICGQRPQWSVDLVVIDGILSWGYEVQVLCPGG